MYCTQSVTECTAAAMGCTVSANDKSQLHVSCLSSSFHITCLTLKLTTIHVCAYTKAYTKAENGACSNTMYFLKTVKTNTLHNQLNLVRALVNIPFSFNLFRLFQFIPLLLIATTVAGKSMSSIFTELLIIIWNKPNASLQYKI